AGSRRADVVLGAGVPVVARRPVGRCQVRAHAARRVARAGDVALIERRAGDGGGRAPAGTVLARLPARAGAAVVARGAVAGVRVGALAGGGVAGAGDVALVERGADDGVRARAGAVLAGVGLGAGVAVGAGRAVRLEAVGWAGGAAPRTSLRGVTLVRGGAAHRARRHERTIFGAARAGGAVQCAVVTLLRTIDRAVATRDVGDADPDGVHRRRLAIAHPPRL